MPESSFIGGVKIKNKCSNFRSEEFLSPTFVCVNLGRRTNENYVPTVSVGDTVKIGSELGVANGGEGCFVHSGVSGKVVGVENGVSPIGERVPVVTVRNDFLNELRFDLFPETRAIDALNSEEMAERMRLAGITDKDGRAVFEQVLSHSGRVRQILINCVDSDPYLSVSRSLAFEHPKELINGAKLLIKALGARKAVFAFDENGTAAEKRLAEQITDRALIDTVVLKAKYPQENEKLLVYSVFGKEAAAGTEVIDIGYAVFKAETAFNVFNAFATGMPVVKKLVSVGGDCVIKPRTVSVAVGTSYEDLLIYCGGVKQKCNLLINGGVMRGTKQNALGIGVDKETDGVLTFSRSEEREVPCIRCGRCITACPMRLMPLYLADASEKGKNEECERLGISRCIECGCCAYVCISKLPLVALIRKGKKALEIASEKENKPCDPLASEQTEKQARSETDDAV